MTLGRRRVSGSLLLLFLSGAASLVFEGLWVKQLGLVVGVDVYAVTIALSGFFGGLAAGRLLGGRFVERVARPARLYAILEAAAGLSGVGATLILSRLAPTYVSLAETVGPLAYALPIAVIGLPAFAMGGALPVLLRAVRPDAARLAGCSGWLYAANTAGAIAGTLAVPFWLVPALGVRGTGLLAGAVDLAVAALALAWSRDFARLETAPSTSGRTLDSADARLAAGLYALAGAAAMGYQVVWSQAIVPFLSTRTAAFAVLLATYLAGLALGSAAWGRVADRVKLPWVGFGALVAGGGIVALASLGAVGPWLPRLQDAAGEFAFRVTGNDTADMCARFLAATAVTILPSTLLLGAAFPAAMRLVLAAQQAGGDLGAAVALNSGGGIAGMLLTGFVLVPWLGVSRSLGALAA